MNATTNNTDDTNRTAVVEKTLRQTPSTWPQAATERECAPFFTPINTLPLSQREHLQQTGLLAQVNDTAVCLLTDQHEAYLQSIFQIPKSPQLRPSFVSLDASRVWMIYWCLHGIDLLKKNRIIDSIISQETRQAMVDTLATCFTKCTVTLERRLVEKCDDSLLLLSTTTERNNASENKTNTTTSDSDNKFCTFPNAGGFGGGPDQLPHAATTYAAVLSLCILAPTTPSALELLENKVRTLVYPWLLSLIQPETGAVRMHHDGEIDVRASYCVVVVATLLNLLLPSPQKMNMARHVAQCQTYEGGFGGEPGTEAHGGYTFCAVAALYVLQQQQDESNTTTRTTAIIDTEALTQWLVNRQMTFEGGFCGRTNKLVDGCYSFWQGAALEIVRHFGNDKNNNNKDDDPWLPLASNTTKDEDTSAAARDSTSSASQLLFDASMLERYILLCGQDVNGGLRDKPSKPRDYYHSCYCLSGLSISQHYNNDDDEQHYYSSTNDAAAAQMMVARTHPCYNIRVEHVSFVLDHFSKYNNTT